MIVLFVPRPDRDQPKATWLGPWLRKAGHGDPACSCCLFGFPAAERVAGAQNVWELALLPATLSIRPTPGTSELTVYHVGDIITQAIISSNFKR